jgi:eukaryotic-like serine/threonine-protein kinase
MTGGDGIQKDASSLPHSEEHRTQVNLGLEATLDRSTLSGMANAASSSQPKSIGAYQLTRKLGEGGMGQVWLAEQITPVKRTVALKLIRVGRCDDEVLQRFQAERQSLAMMDHPAIAKVFDAGSTPDGNPYFVMEYVQGVPIDRYCDQKRLTIKQRLELFIKVCEGVQHAHQKAIIHRDLKPANILVTEVDGKPVPRIIDFGVAKATGPQVGDETMMTQLGGFVGTLGYMSPEQADGTGDVDTRSDVYSLGVVLYVLLTGEEPFDTTRWKKQPFHEMLRQLREIDPPRPSTRIRAERRSSPASADLRGMQLKQLERLLRGDLDWITMQALEKDRSRRYGTPSELAADISRYLTNQPVSAGPASTGYRLQKYLRRHRAAVAVASVLVLLLAGFAVMQAVQLRRVARERDRANRITGFMTDMFKVSDPSEARGESITAREILDKAAKQIETGLAKDPEAQAHMMYVIGEVYDNLGLIPQGKTLLERAAQLQQKVLGSEHPDTLASMDLMGKALTEQGHFAEAENLHRQTLEGRRRILGPEHPDTLHSMSRLAAVLSWENKKGEAESLSRDAVAIARRVLGPEDPNTLRLTNNLVSILWSEGDEKLYSEAERIQREALDIEGRVFGPEHPDTLNGWNSLGVILRRRGQYSEAEKVYRETLRIQSHVLGPQHPDTLVLRHNLATALAKQARYQEAEQMYLENRNIQQRIFGPDHPYTANSTYNLACLAAVQAHRDRALSLLDDSLKHGLTATVALSMEKDEDLISLHGDPRFMALVSRAKKAEAASKKAN